MDTLFVTVSTSYLHTCAITTNGTAYCFGANGPSLRLCSSYTGYSNSYPQLVLGDYIWLQISAGYNHTCGIVNSTGTQKKGTLVCCGDNTIGELGIGSTGNAYATPQPIASTNGIPSLFISVATGYGYTCAISYATSGDNVFCAGSTANGRTGTITTDQGNPTLFNVLTPIITTSIPSPHPSWNSIDVGKDATCIIPVARGASPSASPLPTLSIVAQGGSLGCFGSNMDGVLGHNNILPTFAPLPQTTVVPPSTDINPYTWSSVSVFEVIDEASTVTNNPHACGISKYGPNYVSCWGSNSQNQLGMNAAKKGGTLPYPTFVLKADLLVLRALMVCTGSQYSCAISIYHELYCWGLGTLTGTGTTNGDTYATAQLITVVDATTNKEVRFGYITCGALHAAAITTAGDAYSWGYNHFLVTGTTLTIDKLASVPLPIVGNHQWRIIEAGSNHMCGVTIEGALYCWGRVPDGALGLSNIAGATNYGVPQLVTFNRNGLITDLALGLRITSALRQGGYIDNNIKGLEGNLTFDRYNSMYISPYNIEALDIPQPIAWGLETHGALGVRTRIPTPLPIPTAVPIFYPNRSFGVNNLTIYMDTNGQPVPQIWKSLSMSSRFASCGIYGSIPYCWGDSTLGATGTNDNGIFIAYPKPVDLTSFPNTVWLQIDAGASTTCGIFTNSYGSSSLNRRLLDSTNPTLSISSSIVECADSLLSWNGTDCAIAYLPLVCDDNMVWDTDILYCKPYVPPTPSPSPSTTLHIYSTFWLKNITFEVFTLPEVLLAFKEALIITLDSMNIHNITIDDIVIVAVYVIEIDSQRRILVTTNKNQVDNTYMRQLQSSTSIMNMNTTKEYMLEFDYYIIIHNVTLATDTYQLLSAAKQIDDSELMDTINYNTSLYDTNLTLLNTTNITNSSTSSRTNNNLFLLLLRNNLILRNATSFNNIVIVNIDSNPPIFINGQAIPSVTPRISHISSTGLTSEIIIGLIIGGSILSICIIYSLYRFTRIYKLPILDSNGQDIRNENYGSQHPTPITMTNNPIINPKQQQPKKSTNNIDGSLLLRQVTPDNKFSLTVPAIQPITGTAISTGIEPRLSRNSRRRKKQSAKSNVINPTTTAFSTGLFLRSITNHKESTHSMDTSISRTSRSSLGMNV